MNEYFHTINLQEKFRDHFNFLKSHTHNLDKTTLKQKGKLQLLLVCSPRAQRSRLPALCCMLGRWYYHFISEIPLGGNQEKLSLQSEQSDNRLSV